jgi:hypothetical protein
MRRRCGQKYAFMPVRALWSHAILIAPEVSSTLLRALQFERSSPHIAVGAEISGILGMISVYLAVTDNLGNGS